VKKFKTNQLTTQYFLNKKLGHITVLSTVLTLAFCICVQGNGSSQWPGQQLSGYMLARWWWWWHFWGPKGGYCPTLALESSWVRLQTLPGVHIIGPRNALML